MRREKRCRRAGVVWTFTILLFVASTANARGQSTGDGDDHAAAAAAQAQPAAGSSFEVYGFAMLDIGLDFKQIDPNWFDTMRVTKLPKVENEFGRDHRAFAGVRQSRFGARSAMPTALGELRTTFEFELFGTGVDEGQTTFRLRHAYGEVGQFGAGQTSSPFMDPDVFPNSIEYWGPTGMVFFRNVQVRWMPYGDANLVLALERPGASGDAGVYADRIELQNVSGRTPLPDLTGAYKLVRDWGYVRVGGALRSIKWDDLLDDAFDLSGGATGWGINLSSNIKAGAADTLRLQFVFGEGIQNYMNDSPVDVGIANNFQNPLTPIVGEPLPITASVIFLDHTWSERFSSTIGYSRQDIDNTDGQAGDAFRTGQYALGNLLYTPVPNFMVGGELQWGRRENFNGFHSDGLKVQVSFRYNFSRRFGG
jgi:hypothetical protein